MGLDSIWNAEGEYLTKKSKDFKARSTGCSCCSASLTTESDVKKEAIDSLTFIIKASNYFKWSLSEILKEAEKKEKQMR